jgi:hypothetical protein
MTTAQKCFSALIVCLGLCACGAQEEPPAVKDTVFGDAVGTMDKARAVQDTTLQHKEDLDRALESAEGER